MIRQLAAAAAFLTRLPVAPRAAFDARDVAKSSRWFPLIGALLGLIYIFAARLFSLWLPANIVGPIVILLEALLTGALHMDALADMADGFGGGRTRADILRIMRDHAIGSYGGVALVLLILLKSAAIADLVERRRALPYLLLAPLLGRWSAVLLGSLLPYAREQPAKAVNEFMGRWELALATVIAAAITFPLARIGGLLCWLAVCATSAVCAWMCRRRIGGVTGDTLGANIEVGETAVLLVGLLLG